MNVNDFDDRHNQHDHAAFARDLTRLTRAGVQAQRAQGIGAQKRGAAPPLGSGKARRVGVRRRGAAQGVAAQHRGSSGSAHIPAYPALPTPERPARARRLATLLRPHLTCQQQARPLAAPCAMARMHQCPRCSVGRKTDVIWVAPDENAVVTRFLFAFPNGVYTTALSLPQDSTEPKFEEDVRNWTWRCTHVRTLLPRLPAPLLRACCSALAAPRWLGV